jgi:hypothetical protein
MPSIPPGQLWVFEHSHQLLFREYLISALVKAGALTAEQAAELCERMSTDIHQYMGGLEAAGSLLESEIDGWAWLADAYRGKGPPPKGM